MSNYVRYPLVLAIVCAVAGLGLAVTYKATIGRIEEKEAIKKGKAVVTAFFNAQPVKTDWADYKTVDVETGEEVTDEASGADTCLVARREDGEVLGYAAEGSLQGYSSKVVALVGVERVAGEAAGKYRILGVRIISQNETPGLGAQCNQVFSNETLWSKLAGLFAEEDDPEGPQPTEAQKAALGEDVQLQPRAAFEDQFTGKEVAVADGAVEGLELDKTSWEQVKSGEEVEAVAAITGATITSNAAVQAVSLAILKIDRMLGKAAR